MDSPQSKQKKKAMRRSWFMSTVTGGGAPTEILPIRYFQKVPSGRYMIDGECVKGGEATSWGQPGLIAAGMCRRADRAFGTDAPPSLGPMLFLRLLLIAPIVAKFNTPYNTKSERCLPPMRICDQGKNPPTCYPEEWICDGQRDCEDGADEPPTCEARRCQNNTEFKCASGRCLARGYMCDGESDCGRLPNGDEDMSDEDPAVCHNFVECPANEYRCLKTPVCVHLSRFCDQSLDCEDGSDEHVRCHEKDASVTCDYSGVMTLDGYKCFCPAGKSLVNGFCQFQNPCQQASRGLPPVCTQSCNFFENNATHQCSCVDRRMTLVDGKYCVLDPSYSPTIAFTTKTELIVLKNYTELPPVDYNASKHIGHFLLQKAPGMNFTGFPIVCFVNATVVNENYIHCSSETQSRRYRTKMSLAGVSASIFAATTEPWILFDEMHSNWLICDGTFMAVCRHDEELIRVCHTFGVGEMGFVEGFVYDPVAGYVFYIDGDLMTLGVFRVDIVTGERLLMSHQATISPAGLALDIYSGTLFFGDRTVDTVFAVDYELKHKPRIVVDSRTLKNVRSIAYAEGKLFTAAQRRVKVFDTTLFPDQKGHEIFASSTEEVSKLMAITRVDYAALIALVEVATESVCIGTPNRCVFVRGAEKKNQCLKSWKKQSRLLFARLKPPSVAAMKIETTTVQDKTVEMVVSSKGLSAMTVDAKNGRLISFDNEQHVFLVSDLNSEDDRQLPLVIPAFGIQKCEGLAYDPSSDNLYYTDQGRFAVGVLKLSNSTQRKTLLQGGMTFPRSIVIHVAKSYMFWGSWSERNQDGIPAKIERAKLDGSQRKTLVNKNVMWVNGLTIDAENDYLYWCDAYHNLIERVRFNGADREKIVQGAANLMHPYGIFFSGKWLYWSELKKGRIKRASISNASEIETVLNESSSIFDVTVYDPDRSAETSACSKNNGGCEQLCYSMACKGAVGCEPVKCGCRDSEKPNPDDKSKCIEDKDYMDGIPCNATTHFSCSSNEKCIPKTQVCDGDDDCGDNSDEDPAGVCSWLRVRLPFIPVSEDFTCSSLYFQCDRTNCIPNEYVCDGSRDCVDGSDENAEMCSNRPRKCFFSMFQCDNNTCIDASMKCNGFRDCPNGEDEADCHFEKCASTEFRCGTGACIDQSQVCDGVTNCKDGLDEAHCNEGCIQGHQFRCDSGSVCLDMIFRCDGVRDCSDGSDEDQKFCKGKLFPSSKANEFLCPSNEKCIRRAMVCDGTMDCIDGADELNCPTAACNLTTDFACADGSKCVSKSFLCDGFHDCSDSSDELNCGDIVSSDGTPARCRVPAYRCELEVGFKCITDHQVCDGKKDCPNGDDEGPMCAKKCSSNSCSQKCFQHPSGPVCSCHPGYSLEDDGFSCTKKDPCRFGKCSQRCLRHGSTKHCYCDDGFKLHKDGFTCIADDPDVEFMLYTNRHEIRQLYAGRVGSSAALTRLRNAIALDYFIHTNGTVSVYWSDLASDVIYTGLIENRVVSYVRPLVMLGVYNAEGIAVDWVTGNVYWVDSSLDHIEVATPAGERAIVVSEDITNIRSISLDANEGLMFWTDWQERRPRVEKATMSGNNRTVIFNVSGVVGGGWPNGITCDTIARRVYWVDAKSDSIHTVTYDGKDHVEVARDLERLGHPFSIDVFGNFVFFSDWRTNTIGRVNKWNGTNFGLIERVGTQPFSLRIVHRSKQKKPLRNPCQDAKCAVCLLDGSKGSRCVCPQMTKADKDGTCQYLDHVVVAASKNAIRIYDAEPPHLQAFPTVAGRAFDDVRNVIALNCTIYVLDSQKQAITKIDLRKNTAPEVLVNGDLTSSKGLALDASTGNLYFSTFADGINSTLTSNMTIPIADFDRNLVIWISKSENKVVSLDVAQEKISAFELPSSMTAKACTFTPKTREVLILASDTVGSKTVFQKFSLDSQELRSLGVNLTLPAPPGDGIQYVPMRMTSSKRFECPDCPALCLRSADETKGICQCWQGAKFVDGTCKDPVKTVFYVTEDGALNSVGIDEKSGEQTLVVHSLHPEMANKRILRIAVDSKRDFVYALTKTNEVWMTTRNGSLARRVFYGGNHKLAKLVVDKTTGYLLMLSRPTTAPGGVVMVLDPAKAEADVRVVIVEEHERIPLDFAVDPPRGRIFWVSVSCIKTASYNGSNPRCIFNGDSDKSAVDCVDYEGEGLQRNVAMFRPQGMGESVVFTINGDELFFFDKYNASGSIIRCLRAADGTFVAQGAVRKRIPRQKLRLFDLSVLDKENGVLFTACSNYNGGCEHLCLTSFDKNDKRVSKTCLCAHSQLSANGSCLPYKGFIVFSRLHSIEFAHLPHSNHTSSPPNRPITSEQCYMNKVWRLAVDAKRSRIYFADAEKHRISAVNFDGTGCFVVVEDVDMVEGMAYDNVHQELFFTRLNPGSIWKVQLNNEITKFPTTASPVVTFFKNSPYLIALHPCRMLIYFTLQGSNGVNFIERVYYSGFKREVIHEDGLGPVTGLLVDVKSQKLYYTQRTSSDVLRSDLDGTNVETVLNGSPNYPSRIAIYEDYLITTDAYRWWIGAADKLTGDGLRVVANLSSIPLDLAVMDQSATYCPADLCLTADLKCGDVCRLTADGRPECGCIGERKMSSDNRTCHPASTKCAENEFSCLASYRCIPYEETCDDHNDCPFSDDEDIKYCSTRVCRPGYFSCGDGGLCIPESKRCNRVNDCYNFADEANCTCSEDEFKCSSGVCVPGKSRCDFTQDCNDASDEKDCPPRNCSAIVELGAKMVNCQTTTQCILPSWKCDGRDDCWDGSDERDCFLTFDGDKVSPPQQCQPSEFRCNASRVCMPRHWVCDGSPDCFDGSDEQNCQSSCSPKFEFECTKSRGCIAIEEKCNGHQDCPNGEDELDCEHNECAGEANTTFRCTNHRCIPMTWRCDGVDDCMDNGVGRLGTDEMDCAGSTIFAGRCEGGRCDHEVPCELTAILCDGIRDCSDGFDEQNCAGPDRSCGLSQFMCANGQCISRTSQCDLRVDCVDGSDEWPELCSYSEPPTRACSSGLAHCVQKNGTISCLPNQKLCDGKVDCLDGTFGLPDLDKSFRNDEKNCGRNECLADQTHDLCDQICIDTPNGYECQCTEGFHLSPHDRKTCLRAPSCPLANCSQLCVDRPNSGSQCLCGAGYRLSPNGHDCKREDSSQF
ncbi:unnamed protein product [Caenorhabditis auriculariae]|uniref:EGF-like domain-containing protein n=1 Tax=Caenorhabditis auriculariae TaxID=2777116 RepID=A0A8S1HHQ6_9PELO|nr:unnamed protein product [Caenorhabditis auriculariae]